MKTQLIYMTAADMNEARAIGSVLVAEGLAACVNILGPIDSIFRWEGEVQEDTEVAFLAKTTEARVADLVTRAAAVHSYDCSCPVALPVTGGHAPFLEWIAASTTAAPD